MSNVASMLSEIGFELVQRFDLDIEEVADFLATIYTEKLTPKDPFITYITSIADPCTNKIWRFEYTEGGSLIGPIDLKIYHGDFWSVLLKFDKDYVTLFNKQKSEYAKDLQCYGLINELDAQEWGNNITRKSVESRAKRLKTKLLSGEKFIRAVEMKEEDDEEQVFKEDEVSEEEE